MRFTHLLDTSVLSQPIKDHPVEQVLVRWDKAGDTSVCSSAICLAELRQVLEMRQSQKYWRRFHELIEHRYLALPFDEDIATTYSQLAAQVKQMGKTKPTVDLFIAATAKHHGLILATLNEKDFRDIPGLAVENWSR